MNVRTKWGRRRMLHVDGYADGALSGFKRGQHGIARRMFQKPNKPRRAQYLRHLVARKVDKVRRPTLNRSSPTVPIRMISFTSDSFLTINQQKSCGHTANKTTQTINLFSRLASKFTKQNRSARIHRLALQGFKFGNVLQIPMTERHEHLFGMALVFQQAERSSFFHLPSSFALESSMRTYTSRTSPSAPYESTRPPPPRMGLLSKASSSNSTPRPGRSGTVRRPFSTGQCSRMA